MAFLETREISYSPVVDVKVNVCNNCPGIRLLIISKLIAGQDSNALVRK
jgi:hypothetical protein